MSTLVSSHEQRSPGTWVVPVVRRGAGSKILVRNLAVVASLALAGSAATGSYTVRRGDTLSGIASRHGSSVGALVAANGLTDPDFVVAGRTLQVPGAGEGTGATGAATGSSYTVRSGDTLSEIAAELGVSEGSLVQANGIADPDRLAVGRSLAVPAGVAAAATPAAGGTATSGGLPSRLRASPTRLAYIPIFERWASEYGVPADLLMAMTWLESGWQQERVSSTGAVGIGQIMPDTTAWMRDVIIGEPLDPDDPNDNIRMSARYLRWLLDRSGGDVRLALAGYYQGPAAVSARGLLPETEQYVAGIVALRPRF